MHLKVYFFALYRQLASSTETPVDLPEGATLSQLWVHVQGLYPDLQGYPLIAAVNGEQCDGPTPLNEGDAVAFLPPFSGGCQHARASETHSSPLRGSPEGGPPSGGGLGVSPRDIYFIPPLPGGRGG